MFLVLLVHSEALWLVVWSKAGGRSCDYTLLISDRLTEDVFCQILTSLVAQGGTFLGTPLQTDRKHYKTSTVKEAKASRELGQTDGKKMSEMKTKHEDCKKRKSTREQKLMWIMDRWSNSRREAVKGRRGETGAELSDEDGRKAMRVHEGGRTDSFIID